MFFALLLITSFFFPFVACHIPTILPEPGVVFTRGSTLVEGGTLSPVATLIADGTPRSVPTRLTALTRLSAPVLVATPVSVPTRVTALAGATLKPALPRDAVPTRLHARQLLPSPTIISDPARLCLRQELENATLNAEIDANYTRLVGGSAFWGLISASRTATSDTTVFNSVSLILTLSPPLPFLTPP